MASHISEKTERDLKNKRQELILFVFDGGRMQNLLIHHSAHP